jgi:glycosyltransferase involved in cell wall biosynthesis
MRTDSFLVSIIIPCYRDSKTLSPAIRSLYEQTYSNIEVIVVNDASPETTEIEEIVGRYPKITYIKNDINMGLAATRNVGIKNSKGEYVAFLDADDEWHPRKLELQMRYIAPDTAVACDVEEFTADPPQLKIFSELLKSDIQVVKSNLRFSFQNYLTGASLLTSKALLLKVGGYDETLRSCEDYDLWLRLLEEKVTLINLRLPLYYYRFNASGLSKKIDAISFWELEVMKRHLNRNRKRYKFMLLKHPIWMLWLFRHLVRAAAAANKELRYKTLVNAKSLEAPYLLYHSLRLVDILKIPELFQGVLSFGMPGKKTEIKQDNSSTV